MAHRIFTSFKYVIFEATYKKLIWAVLDILAIKKSSHVFVLSNYVKREKHETYGVDAHVVKGAINHAVLENKQLFSSSLDNKKFTIFTIARIENDKRIDVLIKAFTNST